MAISLYDLSVATYLQTLGAVSGILEKGLKHCNENKIDLNAVLETRIYPDMLPFRTQVMLTAYHCVTTVEAMKSGSFATPKDLPTLDYAGLQKMIADASATLQKLTPEEINAFDSRDVMFLFREMQIPFKVEEFVLSFSLPNVHFHATTAYDILRAKGVPLGKRDYLGAMRIKQ